MSEFTSRGNLGIPVTGDDANIKYRIAPDLMEKLCLLEDGRLLVSKTHNFNPDVRAFVGRLQRQNTPYETFLVSMDVIKAAYQTASLRQHNGAPSDMQMAAKEMCVRASKVRASDIHIRKNTRTGTKIYFRVHNDIEYQEEHSYDYGLKLCSTMYQAMADVADVNYDPNSRQDARISDRSNLPFGIDGIRIATSPQVDGSIMVLRLLYNDAGTSFDPQQLGFSGRQTDLLRLMKKRPTGINIIGGPTGSGKSTTLQRILGSIYTESKGRKHIITVEDPPEYPITGAVQTPVTNAETQEARSRAFQSAISGAMRLDPDILMIGEIRDHASAKLAIEGAMTGHQVWTTLHANSAFGIMSRLIDLDVPVELVCDPEIITGLTCQRLLKVLCPHCKTPLKDAAQNYPQDDLKRVLSVAGIEKIYVMGHGCVACRKTGIKGRTVVAETLLTNSRLMKYVKAGDIGSARNYWLTKQDGFTMLDHAIAKINAGEVDPFQTEDIVGPLVADDMNAEDHV